MGGLRAAPCEVAAREGARWAALLCALALSSLSGLVYGLAGYLPDLQLVVGLSDQQAALVLASAIFLQLLFYFVAGLVVDRLGARIGVLWGGLCCGAGYALAFSLINYRYVDLVWPLILAYGLVGHGCSALYMASLQNTMYNFGAGVRSTIAGVIAVPNSLSPLIVGIVYQLFFAESLDVAGLHLALSATVIVVAAVSAPLMNRVEPLPNTDWVQGFRQSPPPEGDDTPLLASMPLPPLPAPPRPKILRGPDYAVLLLTMAALGGSATAFFLKESAVLAAEDVLSTTSTSRLLFASSLANAAARIIVGVGSDLVGVVLRGCHARPGFLYLPRLTAALLMAVAAAVAEVLMAATGSTPVVLWAGSCTVAFSLGGNLVVATSMISEMFSFTHFGRNYGLTTIGVAVVNAGLCTIAAVCAALLGEGGTCHGLGARCISPFLAALAAGNLLGIVGFVVITVRAGLLLQRLEHRDKERALLIQNTVCSST
eukprot:TRINITY_DN1411_c0_g1_i1.p1 TRINITY_DN1411_c0_g1~~TRINITY_DN1411_c0_g1_i1.p1  ORF type:complete len:494 (+),score=126.02 TRINITY_DN1411_c0_g1_i1:30-1484(+)